MNISELNDNEKSIILGKLAGWTESKHFAVYSWWFEGELIDSDYPFDLYRPEKMALAWRVLNWAYESLDKQTWRGTNESFHHGAARYRLQKIFELYPTSLSGFPLPYKVVYELSPADAQRLWLDKILSLAIEAGLVE